MSRKRVAGIFIVLAITLLAAKGEPVSDRITVLNFNVFDAFFGPNRELRMAALPGAIMDLEPLPDVIVMEEAFNSEHRSMILSGLMERGYPMETVHYHKVLYGTGILLVSRYSLSSFDYTPFRVDGAIYDPEHYSGKGVHHYLLDTPHGPLELFASHPVARFKPLYDEDGNHLDRDRRTRDRIIEMERINRVISERTGEGARSVVLSGDLNASPDMWSYQYLIARTGLKDSYYQVHPGEYSSTYSPDNTMVEDGPENDWSRIDHVLFKNLQGDSGFWLVPVSSEVVFREVLTIGEGVVSHLSDHYGLLSSFEVVTDQDRAAIKPCPDFGQAAGNLSREDVGRDGLTLTPENYRTWQTWAIEAIAKADRNYNRFSSRVVPAARIVIAGKVDEPVTVPLNPVERQSIMRDLLAQKVIIW